MSRHLICVLTACVSLSCTSPVTQLIVVVDTPLAVPADLDTIEIMVAGPSGIETSSREDLSAADAPALPLTLGVTPATETLGPLTVTATGQRGGEEIVRTSARVTLIEGETRVLSLSLVRGCIDRPCALGETCGPGGCQPLEREALPAFDGTIPRYAMEDACDALPFDEDGDGEPSEMCGGLDCADQDPDRGPGAPEACDTIDNDCDGEVDTGCDCAPDGVTESCDTACGSTGIRTCAGGTFGDCVAPDELCNGLDDDCDGLIDEGLTYAGRGETRISDDGQEAVTPRIIAVDEGWRVVYAVPGLAADGGGQFVVRRDTVETDWAAPIRSGNVGLEPDLAASDDGLMLVWTRRVEGPFMNIENRLFARPLSREGSPTDSQRLLRDNVSMPSRPRIVWDGLAFRLAFHDGDLFVTSLDPTGVDVDGTVTASDDRDAPADFALAGTTYAGAWTRGDSVYFISADATLLPTQITLQSADNAEHASLDGSNSGFLVAWFDEQFEAGRPDARSLRVTHLDGVAPSGALARLSDSTGGEDFPIDEIAPPTVRFGGGQYLVTWADQRDGDQEIYFARVGESGEVLQEATRLTVAPGAADQTSAAYVDGRFGVVWSDSRGGDAEVYFAEVACGE